MYRNRPCAPLKNCRSRELRGGILYTDCYCLRRNGLQYDCRRSGCQTSPLCQLLPAPLCGPATEACIKHCRNPHAEACSPCGPMVCYKYEDCGPPKGRAAESANAEENDADKKDSKENQLKRTKSRELRGGIMYYSCHCIKRNGLQHDCRRTGCGGEPSCLALPDPLCPPSQLARARGLADPAALAGHLRAQAGGSGSPAEYNSGSGSGKRFIVCELKGVVPDVSSNKSGQCCKLPMSFNPQENVDKCCNNQVPSDNTLFLLDEKTMETIISRIQNNELASEGVKKPRNRSLKVEPTNKEPPCTRPGCVHWKPPPPCLWNLPCKADCFEAPPGIQPNRNPLAGSGGTRIPDMPHREGKSGQQMIILNPINK